VGKTGHGQKAATRKRVRLTVRWEEVNIAAGRGKIGVCSRRRNIQSRAGKGVRPEKARKKSTVRKGQPSHRLDRKCSQGGVKPLESEFAGRDSRKREEMKIQHFLTGKGEGPFKCQLDWHDTRGSE